MPVINRESTTDAPPPKKEQKGFDMFGKAKLQIGKIYYKPNPDPFGVVWLAKITDIKNRYVKSEAWQEGAKNMPTAERSMSEKDFRFYYPNEYK